MIDHRRLFIRRCASLGLIGLATAAGLLPARGAVASETNGFLRGTIDVAISAVRGDLEIQPSKKIHIKSPETAENGAIVPVSIRTDFEGKQEIALFSEKNPVPLLARFTIPETTLAEISARVKMADSGHLIVMVRTDNALYMRRRFVTVTVGGCGS